LPASEFSTISVAIGFVVVVVVVTTAETGAPGANREPSQARQHMQAGQLVGGQANTAAAAETNAEVAQVLLQRWVSSDERQNSDFTRRLRRLSQLVVVIDGKGQVDKPDEEGFYSPEGFPPLHVTR
jgi:hypothetical protein